MKTTTTVQHSGGVAAEISRRASMWEALVPALFAEGVEPAVLRDVGIYGGAQGCWVDKTRTSSAEPTYGVTVAVLHTGRHYADDLSDDGLLYHFPVTARPPRRDLAEVEATKNCGSFEFGVGRHKSQGPLPAQVFYSVLGGV